MTGHRKHQLCMLVVCVTIVPGTEKQRGISPALIGFTDSSTLNKRYKVLQSSATEVHRSPVKAPKECHHFSAKGRKFIGEMSANAWGNVHTEGLGSAAGQGELSGNSRRKQPGETSNACSSRWLSAHPKGRKWHGNVRNSASRKDGKGHERLDSLC